MRTVEYHVRTYIPDKRGIPKLVVRRDMMSTCGKTFWYQRFIHTYVSHHFKLAKGIGKQNMSEVRFLRPLSQIPLVIDPSLGICTHSIVDIGTPWHNWTRTEQIREFCWRQTTISIFIVLLEK